MNRRKTIWKLKKMVMSPGRGDTWDGLGQHASQKEPMVTSNLEFPEATQSWFLAMAALFNEHSFTVQLVVYFSCGILCLEVLVNVKPLRSERHLEASVQSIKTKQVHQQGNVFNHTFTGNSINVRILGEERLFVPLEVKIGVSFKPHLGMPAFCMEVPEIKPCFILSSSSPLMCTMGQSNVSSTQVYAAHLGNTGLLRFSLRPGIALAL